MSPSLVWWAVRNGCPPIIIIQSCKENLTVKYTVEELSIEIDERCLVGCKHCSSGSTAAVRSNDTRDLQFKAIIEASDMGAETLSLSGGDPILDPSLDSYIKIATECGYKRILLYTSGIWYVQRATLPESNIPYGIKFSHRLTDIIDQYKHRGLIVIFSLHSHISEVNDEIMMPGAFESAIRDILLLTQRGVTVYVHMVPMKPNITHVSSVRALCAILGVSNMAILRFVPQTRGRENLNSLMCSREEFTQLQRDLDTELQRNEHSVSLRIGCPAEFRHAVPGTVIHSSAHGKVKACHAGKDLILIRPDGSVHPCAAWKSLPSDSNIRDHSLRWIWEHDETFRTIREYMETGFNAVFGQCMDCIDLDTCKGGCPAQKLHDAPNPTLQNMYDPCPDPMCPRRI